MEGYNSKSISLVIAKSPTSASPGLKELRDLHAGQHIRVLAKANKLYVETPSNSTWEISENILAYKNISHSLTNGTAEEADLRHHPFQASLHSADKRNRCRIPFYISLNIDFDAVGAWFLQTPGTVSLRRSSHGSHVAARRLQDGRTWIGLAHDHFRPGISTDLICSIGRPSGHLYSVTLVTAHLSRYTLDSATGHPSLSETILDTRQISSQVYHGSSFPDPYSAIEVQPHQHQYTIPSRLDPGFILHPSDQIPSSLFDYTAHFRTYVFYQAPTRDCTPVLLHHPIESGFSTTARFNPSIAAFDLPTSSVLPIRELTDTQLPTWTGHVVLPQNPEPASASDMSRAPSRDSVTSVGSVGMTRTFSAHSIKMGRMGSCHSASSSLSGTAVAVQGGSEGSSPGSPVRTRPRMPLPLPPLSPTAMAVAEGEELGRRREMLAMRRERGLSGTGSVTGSEPRSAGWDGQQEFGGRVAERDRERGFGRQGLTRSRANV